MTDKSVSVEPPLLQSREFLRVAGRVLMTWWNEQGPTLPPPGESYRAWWKGTYDALEDDWFKPSDVYESLRVYAQHARLYWERTGRVGPPPPVFEPPRSPVPSVSRGLALVVGAIVLAIVMRSR